MAYEVTISGRTISVQTPEGETVKMPLEAVVDQIRGCSFDSGADALPPSVRFVRSRGPLLVWIAEFEPRVVNFRWIDGDSDQLFGPGTTYRNVRIALPYTVVFAVFHTQGDQVGLTNANEAFFRNAPLSNLDDRLSVPALLNVSLYGPAGDDGPIGVDGHPVAWICTQHIDAAAAGLAGRRRSKARPSARLYYEQLIHHLFDSGFNRSSEVHEGRSGFSETVARSVDDRISSVETWEQATDQDPDFVLGVNWLKTGYTAAGLLERIYARHHVADTKVTRVADLARLVINHAADSGNPKSD
jgi:hypothetical protein